MNDKLSDKVKMGIAVATLVGIVVLIVIDRPGTRHDEAPRAADTITLVNGTPPAPPPAAIPLPRPAGAPAESGRAATPARPEAPRAPEAAATPVASRGECPDLTAPPKAPDAASAPAKPAPVPPVALEVLPGGKRVYTVVQGDTLYGISVKIFNTPRYYERIYEANRLRIEDPNTLQVGLKLVIPEVTPRATSSRSPAPADASTAREDAPAPGAVVRPAAPPR